MSTSWIDAGVKLILEIWAIALLFSVMLFFTIKDSKKKAKIIVELFLWCLVLPMLLGIAVMIKVEFFNK